jgi:hypothetical protein
MKLRAALALTAVVAFGAIAAGCGSSGDDSSTSDLTKAEFITKADAICQQGNQEIENAAKQQFGGSGRPSGPEVSQFITQSVIPNTQSQVDQIRALGAPSGDEDQINKMLDTVEADVEKAKAAGDINEQTFAEGNALARQYGLKVCGQD